MMNRKRLCACLATSKKSNSLCNNVLSRKNQDLVESYLAKISSSAVPVSESFGSLAQVAFCYTHVKNAAHAGKQWYEEWKSKGDAAEQENESSTEWQPHSLPASTSPSEASFYELDEDSTLISSPSSPMRYSHMAPGMSEEDRAKRVTRVLEQIAKEKDMRKGIVYVLRVSESFGESPGLFKVGYTEDGIDARIDFHEKCHGKITLLDSKPTKWGCRIEKLVHADLYRFHHKQSKECLECRVHHRELFRVKEEEIWKSLHKWTRFFLNYPNPYNKDGTLNERVELPYPAFRRESSGSTPTKKGPKKSHMSTMSSKKHSTKDEDDGEVFSQKTSVSRLDFLGSRLSRLNIEG
ncbi:hypothetical protein N7481_009632 [Penicillium waksmanii]|uniref:uncharacterized protein n=1 Tax=Penicillium waksmanii TaxID=69791 RepID=UPI002546A50E|nr:uncharacterized protein N7481_009632 [Penicillium waksmanii]KAJ5975925.1 hypothetical protein N7481_009632 [Penicillium waksmanii]